MKTRLKGIIMFLFVALPVLFTLWVGWKVMRYRTLRGA